MKLKVDQRFKRSVSGRYEQRTFQAGILRDRPHLAPRKPTSLGSYRGGPIRKPGNKATGRVSEVSRRMSRMVNFYVLPFRKRNSKDLTNLMKALRSLLSGRTKSPKRVERALVDVIVNPILRGEYGRSNSRATAEAKGFSRFMIDTAQMVKAITARAVRRRRSGGGR